MSRVRITDEQAREYAAKGLIPSQHKADELPQAAGKPKRIKHKLREASFTPPPGRFVGPVLFVVPVYTASETNISGNQKWVKNGRTAATRRAVSQTLGPYLKYLVPFAEAYHSGQVVRVVFTRLGGGRLDAMANLGAALKAVEDALAMMLGANDGAANWQASCEQEPGGPYGVLIKLSL